MWVQDVDLLTSPRETTTARRHDLNRYHVDLRAGFACARRDSPGRGSGVASTGFP